jgi:pimeloyl-ACP methyl ester carboxylesterase
MASQKDVARWIVSGHPWALSHRPAVRGRAGPSINLLPREGGTVQDNDGDEPTGELQLVSRADRTHSKFGGMDRPVVLVHGAWHGAWAWERVVPLLTVAGVECMALDLPGHGEDGGPFGDLDFDVARVRQCLDEGSGDVVLVGHSYGGAVITEAGLHPAVEHLVYVAAFALDDGESCVSAAAAESEAGQISHEGRPNLGAGFIMGSGDMITLDPASAEECFYNDCDPDTVAWALARLGPQPLITLQGTPKLAAWRTKPSTYVVCVDDMAVHPELQRIMARRCGSVVEWPTDHSPLLSRPDLVAGLLVDLAKGAA